ncbi:hypothetical protein AMS69_15045 [Haloarcula rubripromontorii]|uniref:Uncharacterized protein n=1 Tax=Haloarcula rubripromontorii TaxID=1705562 RepID=A0A0M9AIF4_9EURY|nr:hypothetical protein [Haloarcula rubripromontorii]KOX92652.1 hypothetical protein AMS69_15045 [Haloarcula rubripromontorii]
MTDTEVAGSTIQIGGATHEFEYAIDEVVEVNGIVGVLLSIPTDETNNRNVLGFDENGSFQWKIEALYPDDKDIPFVYINSKDGMFIADSWMGIRATVDPQTGKITETAVTK